MNQNKSLLIFAAFGAVISNLSLFLLPFCGGNMPCRTTSYVEAILGAVILVLGVASIFAKSVDLQIGYLLAIAVTGLLIVLVPTVIVGVCAHSHMGCHAVSLPVLVLLGAAVASSALATGFFLYRRRSRA